MLNRKAGASGRTWHSHLYGPGDTEVHDVTEVREGRQAGLGGGPKFFGLLQLYSHGKSGECVRQLASCGRA